MKTECGESFPARVSSLRAMRLSDQSKVYPSKSTDEARPIEMELMIEEPAHLRLDFDNVRRKSGGISPVPMRRKSESTSPVTIDILVNWIRFSLRYFRPGSQRNS